MVSRKRQKKVTNYRSSAASAMFLRKKSREMEKYKKQNILKKAHERGGYG